MHEEDTKPSQKTKVHEPFLVRGQNSKHHHGSKSFRIFGGALVRGAMSSDPVKQHEKYTINLEELNCLIVGIR